MRKYQSDVIQKKSNFENILFLTNNISKNHKKEHLVFIRDMLIVEIEKHKHTSPLHNNFNTMFFTVLTLFAANLFIFSANYISGLSERTYDLSDRYVDIWLSDYNLIVSIGGCLLLAVVISMVLSYSIDISLSKKYKKLLLFKQIVENALSKKNES